MYKVMIVDDELLVRTNLKTLIDWDKEQLFLCTDASNGLEAIDLIERQKPHIVITDMLMPKMSGLELCKSISEGYPDVSIIALSNSDDFEFVRGALQCGAVDYLLKGQLSKESLSAVIRKAKDKISNRVDKNTLVPLPDNLSALKRNFILELVSISDDKTVDFSNTANLLGINLTARNIFPIIVSIDNFQYKYHTSSALERKTFISSVTQIIEGVISKKQQGISCYLHDDIFIILLFDSLIDETLQDNKVLTCVKKISNIIEKFLNISASFSIGNTCHTINDLTASFRGAEEAINSKFYLGNKCIIRGNSNVASNQSIDYLDIAYEKDLINYVNSLKYYEVENLLKKVFSKIKIEQISIVNCQVFFNELFIILNRIAKAKKVSFDKIYDLKIPAHQIISQFDTIDNINILFNRLFKNLIDQIRESTDTQNYSKNINKALTLIDKTELHNISLEWIANEIGISNSYLSTMFKKEMGISFTKYILDLKINKAIILLESGNTNLKEIIMESGFNDYNYFFKLFKKNTGMTPKEYMQKYSS